MLRLGGDHSFNPHVYLADKSSCSINSESCIETLMETMTDRDSDDLLSPSGSLSQPSKKNIAQSAPGTLSNGRSVTPESQHLGIFSNSGSGYPQYSYYRPDTVSSKQRTSISASTAWQLQDRNQYVPSNQKGFSGSNRLHPEAGEFEPGRGLVDYGTSIVGHKSRTDYRALDMNRNQPLSSNVMPQSYAYRSKQVDQHQGYSGPRSQNIPIFSNSLRVSPQSNRSAGQMPVRYDECESNRLTQSNRLSFGNTLFAAGRDSWDRSSLTQMDPDSSLSQISHSGSARFTQGNPRSFAYDDYSRSRPNSFSTGRISHGDNSEIGLDSESERQSFLFPNDYDPGNQSFSLSDYDLLRDAVYANTTQSIPLHTFGHEEDSNSSTRNLRYEDIDYTHESYRDSRMLAYFLKDSM